MNSIFSSPSVTAAMGEPAPSVEPASDPIESNGLIQKLRARFSSSANELERKQAEMEQVGRDMRLAEQELGRLTVILQNETDSLKHADEAFAGRKGQILQLEQSLANAWGNQAMQEGPNYATLIALRASVDDFPRCRKHLVAKVEAAKRALKEFEKNST